MNNNDREGLRALTGHSVSRLLSEAMTFEEQFQRFLSGGRKLDRFYISTQYPDALPELVPFEAFDESDASEAVKTAQDLYQFVESYFK